jgi:membrane protein
MTTSTRAVSSGRPNQEDTGQQKSGVPRQHPGIRLFLAPKRMLGLVKSAYSEFSTDKGTRMAASLAYYTTFSIAPILVIAIAIAGLVFGDKAAQNAITGQIQGFVGHDSARMIQTMIQSAHKPAQGAIATIIGIVSLLLGASGVFGEIQDALNTIWNVNAKAQSGIRQLVKTRLLSFGMVLVIGFLLLVSLMISAFLAGLFKYVAGVVPVPEAVLHVVELVVSIFVIGLLFAMMFKVLPDVKLTWKDVSFGAFTTAVLFTLGKFVIGIYLGKTMTASSYGAAGSLILVIAWIYYSALILYFGAEFTRAYATEYGSRMAQRSQKQARPQSNVNEEYAGASAPAQALAESPHSVTRASFLGDKAQTLRQIPAAIRSALRLAKLELKTEAAKAVNAGAILIAGGVLASYGAGFAFLAALYALRIPIPEWVAALVVTAVSAGFGVTLLALGRRRLRQVHVKPERTPANLKRDFRLLKAGIAGSHK